MAGIAFNAATQPVSATDVDNSAAEFQTKLAACAPDNGTGRLELAAWAVDHDLLDEADQLLRDLVDVDPGDDECRAALAQIASRRKLPADSAALDAAISALPAHFSKCESSHFVVISDAGLVRAREHAELLERAEHQFRRFAARLNLRPLPLAHKLVCVLFRSIDDYREFASTHDGVDADWVTGYYAPADDRIVFYDAELVPPTADASAMLDQAGATITAIERKVRDLERSRQTEQAQTLRLQADTLRQQRDQANEHLDAAARAAAIATAVHEATHQLLYHTRVQGLQVRSPLWISEGLATNFETDTPNQAFGPDHEHQPRRSDFDRYLSEGRLLALSEFVQVDQLSGGDEHRAAVVYAQSYALVKWMCRFKSTQLRTYLGLMRIEMGEPSAQRHLELFESAFGEAAQLERGWLRHERDGLKSRQAAIANAHP